MSRLLLRVLVLATPWSALACGGARFEWVATPLAATAAPPLTPGPAAGRACEPAYPDVCIAPASPDLDCADVPYRRFRVLAPDPHRFDTDGNGLGCEG